MVYPHLVSHYLSHLRAYLHQFRDSVTTPGTRYNAAVFLKDFKKANGAHISKTFFTSAHLHIFRGAKTDGTLQYSLAVHSQTPSDMSPSIAKVKG